MILPLTTKYLKITCLSDFASQHQDKWMYEHGALGYKSRWSGCLTKPEAVEHTVTRQLLNLWQIMKSPGGAGMDQCWQDL